MQIMLVVLISLVVCFFGELALITTLQHLSQPHVPLELILVPIKTGKLTWPTTHSTIFMLWLAASVSSLALWKDYFNTKVTNICLCFIGAIMFVSQTVGVLNYPLYAPEVYWLFILTNWAGTGWLTWALFRKPKHE